MSSQIASAGIVYIEPRITKRNSDEYLLLTKEDLIRIDQEQPKWRKIRAAIIMAFWVLWASLITAACLFIGLSSRCSPRPSLEFWESSTGYWANPFSFKDSDGDLVGDLKGLINSVDYLRSVVGVGFVILTPLVPVYPLGLPNKNMISLENMLSVLGDINDFDELLKAFKKKGLKTVVSLNFNSVPLDHKLVLANNLVPPTQQPFCRVGERCVVSVGGIDCYSSYGSGSNIVDLKLSSSALLTEIKDSIRFWFMKGADGVLLEDAAFYIEEGVCNHTSWNKSFPSCKLYTKGTIAVVQELRALVDEISGESGRQRVLIADPGNTGYDPKYAELLLGTDENPGAHMVISRHFVSTRGTDPASAPTFEMYKSRVTASVRNQLALSFATPIDKPHQNVISLALTFLLPGTPIIYAGSELGWEPSDKIPPVDLFPIGSRQIPDNYYGFLPMPWDLYGVGFSKNKTVASLFQKYLNILHIDDTVETVLAAGRGECTFALIRSLIELRKGTPSLLWGDLVTELSIPHSSSVQMFKRSAKGFDAILVLLVENSTRAEVIDFSSECSTLAPVVIFPSNKFFRLNEELSNLQIFISKAHPDAVYVFKCHTK